MKKMTGFTLVASALMFPVLATAATTTELKLIGKIIPAACTPSFVGGSTIDYGNIPVNTLNATESTALPLKTTNLSVVCDAPVKFAISLKDERSATTVTTLNTVTGYGPTQKFGLGAADNGANIGAYSLQMSGPKPGVESDLYSSDGGATWVAAVDGLSAAGGLYGFGGVSATTPAAYASLTVPLNIYASVDKTDNLPTTDTINIDGLVTFEVNYL